MNQRVFGIFAGLSVAISCGTPSGQINEGDVRTGWQATESALIHGLPFSETHNYTYNCPDGGTAEFNASTGARQTLLGGVKGSLERSVTFSQCKCRGVEINGQLEVEKRAKLQLGQLTAEYEHQGSIQWSGHVNGNCDIDVSATGKINVGLLGNAANFSYDGDICGMQASTTLSIPL